MEFTLHHLFSFNQDLKLSDLIWRTLKETEDFKYCYFLDGKITQTLEECDYKKERLESIRKEIIYLEGLDENGRLSEMAKDLAADLKSYQQVDAVVKKRQALRLKLLQELDAWEVPSELEKIKRETKAHLEKYQIANTRPPHSYKDLQDWYQQRIDRLYQDSDFYIKWCDEDRIRVTRQNSILKALWSQLGQPPEDGPICRCETSILIAKGCQCGAAKQEVKSKN